MRILQLSHTGVRSSPFRIRVPFLLPVRALFPYSFPRLVAFFSRDALSIPSFRVPAAAPSDRRCIRPPLFFSFLSHFNRAARSEGIKQSLTSDKYLDFPGLEVTSDKAT